VTRLDPDFSQRNKVVFVDEPEFNAMAGKKGRHL
jgi:hypothetical protein